MKKAACFWWLLFAPLMAGCNRQDTEALTRIASKVQSRSEVVTGAIRANAAASLGAVGDLGLEGRIAARLRWDKELSGANIEVSSNANGIELRGQVQSMEQRRRAVMLAETTSGAGSVTDLLTQSE